MKDKEIIITIIAIALAFLLFGGPGPLVWPNLFFGSGLELGLKSILGIIINLLIFVLIFWFIYWIIKKMANQPLKKASKKR